MIFFAEVTDIFINIADAFAGERLAAAGLAFNFFTGHG
jgi:hypothetical protein